MSLYDILVSHFFAQYSNFFRVSPVHINIQPKKLRSH